MDPSKHNSADKTEPWSEIAERTYDSKDTKNYPIMVRQNVAGELGCRPHGKCGRHLGRTKVKWCEVNVSLYMSMTASVVCTVLRSDENLDICYGIIHQHVKEDLLIRQSHRRVQQHPVHPCGSIPSVISLFALIGSFTVEAGWDRMG